MLFSTALQFAPNIEHIVPLGNGLINDTYLVTTPGYQFVLQRINRKVFSFPEKIIANYEVLNQHMKQKKCATTLLQLPELIKTPGNDSFYVDEQGDFWRALSFITNSETLEAITSINDVQQIGFALGHFHRLLSDLDSTQLYDTLPDFHITPEYLNHYQKVLGGNPVHSEHRYCADFIDKFQHLANELETARQEGLLNMRVIHGDPKIDNFLFEKNSGKIIGIVDLDTVKPGLVHYDIGDCIRSCCRIADSGEFDVTICGVLLKSYLDEAKTFFSGQDFHYLYSAIRLIPFELGLRFYTDYLQGNSYFKVRESTQNLQRAISQFRLCESIIAQESSIRHLLEKLSC